MNAKEYLIWNLQLEIDGRKAEIRQAKKMIKAIEQMQTDVRRMGIGEVEATLKDDEELYNAYIKIQQEFKDKEKKQLEEMRRSGKLREVFYNANGEEIDEDGNRVEGGRKVDPKLAASE